jgi:hypothetical protein
VTVSRLSFTTIAADRRAVDPFEPNVTATIPSPCPVEGLIWIHAASLEALQEHSRAAVTVASRRVPDEGREDGMPLTDVEHFTAPGSVIPTTALPPHAAATQDAAKTTRIAGAGRCTRCALHPSCRSSAAVR